MDNKVVDLTKYFKEEQKVNEIMHLFKKIVNEYYPKSFRRRNEKKLKFKSLQKMEGSIGYFQLELSTSLWVIYQLDIDMDPIEILAIKRTSVISSLLKDFVAGTLKVISDFLNTLQKTKMKINGE